MSSSPTTSAPCQLVRANSTYDGKQGFTYLQVTSTETTGSKAICTDLLRIPPGAAAKAPLHEAHEKAIYVISGSGRMLRGEHLEEIMDFGPEDMICIPAGVPHFPVNTSDAEQCVAILARTDPNEQESAVLRLDLDHLHDGK